MLALTLAVTLAADDCAWKDPKEPPKLEATVFGTAEFTMSQDPNAFRCAKKAGGKLVLIWSVGEGGNLLPLEPKPLTSYSERTTLSDKLCEKPGLKQVQATLKGEGAMSKLDWSSPVIEIYCPVCQWAGDDNMLVLHTRSLTPAGSWTLEATFDEKWYACARKTGTLELRLFTGETTADVKKLTQPTFVVKGLEGPKVKKVFPRTEACKGKPKTVGYELGGTGEFQILPPKGRAFEDTGCP